MRYVGEALKGQLAQASASGAGDTSGVPESWAALKREVLALVRSAAPHSTAPALGAGPPPVREHPRETVEALGHLVAPRAALPPGAPAPSELRVRGIRGLQEFGAMHEVVACDPCLPTEAWVTRCGWGFGDVRHVLYQGTAAPITCLRCIRYAEAGGGALSRQAQKRPREPG